MQYHESWIAHEVGPDEVETPRVGDIVDREIVGTAELLPDKVVCAEGASRCVLQASMGCSDESIDGVSFLESGDELRAVTRKARR